MAKMGFMNHVFFYLFIILLFNSCEKKKDNELPLPVEEKNELLEEIDYSIKGDGSHKVVGYMRTNLALQYLQDNLYDNLTHIILLSKEGIDEDGRIFVNEEIRTVISEAISRRGDRKTKVFIGFGGGNDKYIPLTEDSEKLRNYAESVKELCQEYQLDGVDMDWEHPENAAQHIAAGKLAKELYTCLHPINVELSQAVIWYNIGHLKAIENYVDFINVMIYDNFDNQNYHSPYDQFVGYLDNIISKGIAKEKILAGIPFYGYFALKDWNLKGGTPYFQILNKYNPKIGEDVTYTEDGVALSFESVVKVWKKCAYILEKDVGGVMIFEPWMDIPNFKSDSSLMFHVNSVFPVNNQ